MRIKQVRLGMWLGAIRTQAGRAMFYVGIGQTILVAVAATTKVQEWFPWLSFPLLCLLLVLLFVVTAVLDYILIQPADFEFNSAQSCKHPNPAMAKILENSEDLKKIKKKLGVD